MKISISFCGMVVSNWMTIDSPDWFWSSKEIYVVILKKDGQRRRKVWVGCWVDIGCKERTWFINLFNHEKIIFYLQDKDYCTMTTQIHRALIYKISKLSANWIQVRKESIELSYFNCKLLIDFRNKDSRRLSHAKRWSFIIFQVEME